MSVSSIQNTPVQKPLQQPQQKKVNDHDGDAADVRADQKAALTKSQAASQRLVDVRA